MVSERIPEHSAVSTKTPPAELSWWPDDFEGVACCDHELCGAHIPAERRSATWNSGLHRLLIVPLQKLFLSSTTTIQRPTLNVQPLFYNLVSLCSTDSCTLQLISAITQVLRSVESMSGDTGPRHSKRPRRSSHRRNGGHRATSLSDACPSRFRLDQLRRHEEFWLDDGTIVLVAQDTAFRVYRGLLAS